MMMYTGSKWMGKINWPVASWTTEWPNLTRLRYDGHIGSWLQGDANHGMHCARDLNSVLKEVVEKDANMHGHSASHMHCHALMQAGIVPDLSPVSTWIACLRRCKSWHCMWLAVAKDDFFITFSILRSPEKHGCHTLSYSTDAWKNVVHAIHSCSHKRTLLSRHVICFSLYFFSIFILVWLEKKNLLIVDCIYLMDLWFI